MGLRRLRGRLIFLPGFEVLADDEFPPCWGRAAYASLFGDRISLQDPKFGGILCRRFTHILSDPDDYITITNMDPETNTHMTPSRLRRKGRGPTCVTISTGDTSSSFCEGRGSCLLAHSLLGHFSNAGSIFSKREESCVTKQTSMSEDKAETEETIAEEQKEEEQTHTEANGRITDNTEKSNYVQNIIHSELSLNNKLRDTGSSIPSDESTASWIAAMAALPMAPGCLIAGWLMEKFGRRNSHYMICAPFLLGWLLIACANNLALMLLGRFFTGLCVGLLGPLGPVFISETTDPKYRGIFLAGISLAIAVGILVAHVIGTFVHWQWTAMICCVFPVISIMLLTIIPESPTWLISKGQTEDGIKAFGWLRGYSDEAKAELKGILDSKKAEENKPVMTLGQQLANLKSPELLKPLMIMIIFFVTCQFSGVNAIAFYSIEIIEKAVGKGLDHYLAMIVIDSLRTVMSVVACVICKKYGRRPLCMISGIFTAVSMVGLSMYLYWTEGTQTNMTWLPLTCLMTYICAISIGLVPLPWMMCGELFPTKVRGLGSGISSATTFVAFFVVVKTAPGMMSNLGEVTTFLTYGLVALIGTCVLYFILPETKGKSLQEIEEKFKKPKQTGTLSLTMLMAYFITTPLMDSLGRRYTHIILTIPAIAGWLVIVMATTVSEIIIGRILNGISIGMLFTLRSALIGEYTSPQYRGGLLTTASLSQAFGSEYSAIIMAVSVTPAADKP
ncbi:unnamed protein product [Leptidea sinapis]|uniref:Major facilitator superfamily (MFS) profile domain-containing protein n=1 Tax=Leptidea sinapis TaxID=189913 RepID=A0A5E4PWH0_9NEOP|nr:unnamed protein product [Leptidea sinapis]